MNVMAAERAFCSWLFACVQNAGIIRVYDVASGFDMLFYRGAEIPIRSRLVFSPRDFQLLLLSLMYENRHVL